MQSILEIFFEPWYRLTIWYFKRGYHMKEKWGELEKGFATLAAQYDEIYYKGGFKQKLMNLRLKEVIAEVDPKKGEGILEIGPGSGAYTLALLEKGAKVTSVDISEEMIEVCKKRVEDRGFKVEFYQGNILNIPVENETMNKGIAIGIMTHLPEKRLVSEAVAEMLRVVKRGGAIWFDLPKYHPAKILYTKLYLRLQPHSEESGKLENHLFSNRDIEKLKSGGRTISTRKFGKGIYYLVKIEKNA
jgi:ubiquinone/menaquinone biosynthesis C-methylase UbiE